MGKRRMVAETGAGQHGVATATVAALLGLECVVYMGTVDMARQQPNVLRMRLLGAEVRPVDSGSRTLKDAINEAIRDWVTNVGRHPLSAGLGARPASLPDHGARVPGRHRARSPPANPEPGRAACRTCASPAWAAAPMPSACSTLFAMTRRCAWSAWRPAGEGIATGRHAARFCRPALGRPGVLHGTYTYVLQDADGQIADTHSISAGLDYAAVGPEHAYLRDMGRAEYTSADDGQALAAFQRLARLEGILPALESSHAVAEAIRRAPGLPQDAILLVNLSGRGDKDLDTVLSSLRRSAMNASPHENGIQRIAAAFAGARNENRAALMPYMTLGFPDPEASMRVMAAIAAAGADLIELGVPFSDPLADGPTIQHSTQLALEHGASVAGCLRQVAALRDLGVTRPSC